VYIGMDDRSKRVVAFKLLNLTKIDKESSLKVREIRHRLAITEPQLMMTCDSENIIKCYDVYQNQWLKVMVIEYCNGMTLQEEINEKKRIPEKEAIFIMRQLINGVAVRLNLLRNCIGTASFTVT
jgi:serine/threonine protein kinase